MPKKDKFGKPGSSTATRKAAKKPAAKNKAAKRPAAKNLKRPSARTSQRAEGTGNARESLCPVSHLCGACSHIDQPYAEQLAVKQQRVAELFGYLMDGDADNRLRPIKGMADPFHYRNKVISPFAPGKVLPAKKGDGRGKRKGAGPRHQILTGMYAAGTHMLVDTGACLLENRVAMDVVRAIKQLMGKFSIAPYDEDSREGFMRHAVVRVGHTSGEVLVTLVTNEREFPRGKSFARELVAKVPAITTVVQNVNTRATNVVLGNEEHVLYGPGFILDTLCDLSFRISSTSFYQVSAGQTEVLYQTAIDLAKEEARLPERPVVLDAYCGTGTIGLVAASQMEDARVIGVDSVASSIADARLNARHNGIENAEFVANDAGEFMSRRAADGLSLDVLFMDPPRAGSDEAFLSAAVVAAPGRIVYISCNPQTQARDVAYLLDRGYCLEAVQPVDMFPHTDHIECIVLLTREDDAEKQ